MPIGRSTGSNRISASTRSIPSEMPTDEMNSDTTTSAPNRRQICRKGDSDTPAMGARKRGTPGLTGIGQHIAIPHCRSLVVSRLRCAFGRSVNGVDFRAIDDQPVRYVFLIVAPPLEVSNQYLPVLGKIAQFAKESDVPGRLAKLNTPAEFLTLLEEKNI